MKKLIKYLSLSMLLAACELVVDVKVPVEAPKLTLNCSFSPDTSWIVYVTKTKYILDEGDYQRVTNAVVTVKENNTIVDVLHHTDQGQYVSTSMKRPEAGKSYTIEASAPGMASVSSYSYVPMSTGITSVKVRKGSLGGIFGGDGFSFHIAFQDDPTAENYYEISLVIDYWYRDWETGDTTWYTNPVYIYTDDPAFSQDGVDGVIFDDKLVNGKEVKLTAKSNGYYEGPSNPRLILRTLSKELYLYKITSSLQNYSSGDPFAQPVHVYNNITNGFGIFGGYSESEKAVE